MTHSVENDAGLIGALVDALQRTERNLAAAVGGRPVRDLTENFADNARLVRAATRPIPPEGGES